MSRHGGQVPLGDFTPPAFHFRGRKESGGLSSLFTHDLSEIIYLNINPTDVQVRAEILEIGNVALDMGGAPSSIPIASSYKKTGFQMSNKNAGFFPILTWWRLIPKLVALPDPATT